MRQICIIIASFFVIGMASGLMSWHSSASLNQPAQVIGMPFISTDWVTYAMPASFGGFLCTEFNDTFLARSDAETLDIDFPLFTEAAETVLGPVTGVASVDGTALGDSSTANVLPFGPAGLAFPSIGQTAAQSYEYADTYFFSDTLGIGA